MVDGEHPDIELSVHPAQEALELTFFERLSSSIE
jgi:hypothetical protein